MARINQPHTHGFAGPCALCGEPATAYWQGPEVVRVCAECAQSKLPALIADASLGRTPATVVSAMLLNFWRALALAWQRAPR